MHEYSKNISKVDEVMVFENPVIKELIEKTRVIWALGHATSLMSWDTETYMPPEGSIERGIAMGELSVLRQKIILSPEIVGLVEKAEKQEDLNDYEKGVVRVLRRAIRIAKALPPKLVYELSKISEEARVVWREAREKDDYSLFKPYLGKIVKLSREAAEYLGYEEHPYDALLDLYEEGLRTRDVDNLFSVLEPGIKSVFDKVYGEKLFPSEHELEKARYDKEAMEKVNLEILRILGFPLGSRSRIDVSAHPFTIHMGIKDVRITTRYEGVDFKATIYSVIHEFGHALYELQIDEKLMATPLSSGVSLGIHESQSRFWENIVGRSRYFIEAIYPILREHLNFLEKYSVDDIYMYVNTVRPSLIRVAADEVTYNFHILLRFKLEKQLIAGEIGVDELPELWNNEMERLLGVKPRSYKEGVLQDIHWSMGNIGYFPTYTIGNVVSAQIRHHILKDIPDFYNKILNKDFKPIREYLREKIHRWGSTYEPKELLRRAFGEEMNPKYFIDYLIEKYLKK